jgi:WD40 repeat protein
MPQNEHAEYDICEVLRADRAAGLGFAIDLTHVVTCAHVVNAALRRSDKLDRARPEPDELIGVRFPIGSAPGGDTRRSAHVCAWLPGRAPGFEADDIAVLELTERAPEHVSGLRPQRYVRGMPVQMWGPQPGRPDGGHVRGVLLGEVRGGRLQVETGSGPFRVRPGFSGGPVWDAGTGDVAGLLSACGVEDDAVDAYVLGADRIGEAWPPWLRYLRGDSRSGYGEDLLDWVADAARHHTDFGEAEMRRIHGTDGDRLLATIETRIGNRVRGSMQHLIGAHDGDVTADQLDAFVEVVRTYRARGVDLWGTLVYTGQPAPAGLRNLARLSGIDLCSLPEFQIGVDLRPFADRQHRDLAGDARYPQHGYVPQRYTVLPALAVAGEPLIDRMLGWLAEPDGHLVIVLAPFGHGKTYLLHELARQMHRLPDYPAIPVLVRLRDLERSHDIDELVAVQLTRGGERRVDLDRLAYLRREGRIVLLFDGFDELDRRSSYDQAAAHLAVIVQAAEGRAKVVLTSRRESFLTDKDAPAALARRVPTRADRRIVHITDFAPEQIRMFLAVRLGEDAANRFMGLLERNRLLELAANPRMLSLLTEIGEDGLGQLGRSGTAVTKASVFERILADWLTGEYERLHPQGSQPGPWVEALRKAVTSLAGKLWSSGAASLTPADLEAEAGVLMAVPGPEPLDRDQAVHVLGSGSLLVRVGDEQFDFVHRSLMEWLAIRTISAQLGQQGDRETFVRLASRPFTSLQIDMLGELTDLGTISSWVQDAAKEADDRVRLNALAVAQQLSIPIVKPPVLRGQDLRGQDLTGQDLAGADLKGTDLTDALLDGADLRRADLTGAKLIRTRLDRADLTGATFSGADLRDARLLGADLRQAQWTGMVSALRATTIGARTDDAAIQALRAGGATLPDHAPDLQAPGVGIGNLTSLSFAPTRELIAVACGLHVQIWNVISGSMVRTLAEQKNNVSGIAWSPDGQYLASGGRADDVLVWDARTGQLIRTLAGHTDEVGSLAWSPDSRTLVTGSDDKTIRLWDISTGRQVRTIADVNYGMVSITWSTDGRQIAGTDGSDAIWIWDVVTGRLMQTLPAQFCGAVAWSPDGHSIAAGDNYDVKIWEIGAFTQTSTLTGHTGDIRSLAWSPDSRYLASGSNQDASRVWNAETSAQLWMLTDGRLSCKGGLVAWSPDGKYLASIDRWHGPVVHIWDAQTGVRIQDLAARPYEVSGIAWSPDGEQILATSADATVRFWNTRNGALAQSLSVGSGLSSPSAHPVAWSPAGRHIVTGRTPSEADIWDVATGETILNLSSDQIRTTIGLRATLAWSPDGQRIAYASNDDGVRLWSAGKGQLLRTVHDSSPVSGLAWSPDSQRIIADDEIWNVTTGTLIRSLGVRSANSAAWSPDGNHIAIAAGSDPVRIFSSGTGALEWTLTGHDGSVISTAWSPDGSRLATGGQDEITRVWTTRDGHLARKLTGSCPVTSVAWSPDSSRLATGGEDSAVCIWEAGTGLLLGTLLPLADDGWAVIHNSRRYACQGTVQGEFWWAVDLTRFEAGELEPHLHEQHRVPADTQIAPPRP